MNQAIEQGQFVGVEILLTLCGLAALTTVAACAVIYIREWRLRGRRISNEELNRERITVMIPKDINL